MNPKSFLPEKSILLFELRKSRLLLDTDPVPEMDGSSYQTDSTSIAYGCLMAEGRLDEDTTWNSVLAEVEGFVFEPDRVIEELAFNAKGVDPSFRALTDRHLDLDEGRYALFRQIYDLDAELYNDSSELYFSDCFEVHTQYGHALCIEPFIWTEYENSPWVRDVALQAYLDAAEKGCSLSVVDVSELDAPELLLAQEIFTKFGFKLAHHETLPASFLYRDPLERNPRVSLDPPAEAFKTEVATSALGSKLLN